MFNFLLRKVGSRTDAEDLTQETFLRAWQRIDAYRPQWKFSTWLYTIATRLAISHARRSSASPKLSTGFEEELPTNTQLPNEDRAWIWRLVDEVLTPDQRTAVWLRYVEDLGIGDIAAVMGKSQVGVRVMLFRARSVLAERIPGDATVDLKVNVAAIAASQSMVGGVR